MSALEFFWKHCGKKEKLLVTSNFSFSHSVFYTFWELSDIFIKFKIVVCKLFQFRRARNLSFGKRLTLSKTINVRLFQTERLCRRQFQIWWAWMRALQAGRKHCGKRRNFSFSHSVFKRRALQPRKKQGLFGKGLNESVCRRQVKCDSKIWNSPLHGKKALWEKEKILVTNIFSFWYNVFKSFFFLWIDKTGRSCSKELILYQTVSFSTDFEERWFSNKASCPERVRNSG